MRWSIVATLVASLGSVRADITVCLATYGGSPTRYESTSSEVLQFLLCAVNMIDFLSLRSRFRLTVFSKVFHHLGGIFSFR